MTRKVLGAIGVLAAVLIAGCTATPTQGPGQRPMRPKLRPVIFVHGGAGSGAQFESQAQRLTSNGYPNHLIAVHEYDSTFGINTMAQVHEGLDALIAEMLERSGANKVDLLGHSLGTAVSQQYLSTPERAAKVAHYVNLDGGAASAPPGGVPTLAVWGEGNQEREIVGAKNYYAPGQSHVQVATSKETFGQFYEFFTGRKPRTLDVVPEEPNRVRISGEANLFPSNVGAPEATLEIWEVNGKTGVRRGHRPVATYEIGDDGEWGPTRVDGRKHYEFALSREDETGETSIHHFYYQPFFRSDHLIRLLTSEPGTGIDLLRDQSDRHTTVNTVRYKEFWGDQGANNDTLSVNGANVINATTSPRSKRTNAVFTFDDNSDGRSNLNAQIADVSALPFIIGVDHFIPAADPASRTVPVKMVARAGDGEPEVINVRNFASTDHHVTVQFRDYEQNIERFAGRGRGRGR